MGEEDLKALFRKLCLEYCEAEQDGEIFIESSSKRLAAPKRLLLEQGRAAVISIILQAGFTPYPSIGQKIQLQEEVVRWGDFTAPAGLTGTVNVVAPGEEPEISAKMDQHIEGAQYYENCIHWQSYYGEGGEVISSGLEDFLCDCELLDIPETSPLSEQVLHLVVQSLGGELEGKLPDHRECTISYGKSIDLWQVSIYSSDKPLPDIAWKEHQLSDLIAVGKSQHNIDITTVLPKIAPTAMRLSHAVHLNKPLSEGTLILLMECILRAAGIEIMQKDGTEALLAFWAEKTLPQMRQPVLLCVATQRGEGDILSQRLTELIQSRGMCDSIVLTHNLPILADHDLLEALPKNILVLSTHSFFDALAEGENIFSYLREEWERQQRSPVG